MTPTSHAFPSSNTSPPSLYSEEDEPTLNDTYRAIADRIPTAHLVVLDDLSDLLLLGFLAHEISRFVRSLLALARKVTPFTLPVFPLPNS